MKPVLIFRHIDFEGPGYLGIFLEKQQIPYEIIAVDAGDSIIHEPGEAAGLVFMGGPMSVNDEARLPWLVPEKAFIRAAIERRIPVLGICLGAQLIANALGATVQRGEKEIGWFPVEGRAPAGCFPFPDRVEVFHWHGETFALPAGATHLARSEGCENQAFQVGDRVIGLQFHLETTPESARRLVTNCRDELTAAPFVQSEAQPLGGPPERYRAINAPLAELLTYLAATARRSCPTSVTPGTAGSCWSR